MFTLEGFVDKAAVTQLWNHVVARMEKNKIQSDWAQLDDTQFDFIKNKPDINAIVHEAIYGLIDGNIENISNNRATQVRDYNFYQHKNLTSVILPNVEDIGHYSFYKCDLLNNIDMQSATSIGDFAFKGCSSLTAINFPLLTTIGQGVFDECSALNTANLPLVESVSSLSFRQCTALTRLDLPLVTNIGAQAFYGSNIDTLILRSNTMCVLENASAFYFTPIEASMGSIYVPSALIDTYKADETWSVYANYFKAIEDYPEIVNLEV